MSRRAKRVWLSNLNAEGNAVVKKKGAMSSTGSTKIKGEKTNSRSVACCARCRNHYYNIPIKGHKRYCRYYECTCIKCQVTTERQRVMAKQTKLQRDMAQDEGKVLALGEVSLPHSLGTAHRQVEPRPRSVDTDHGSSNSGHSGRSRTVKVEPAIKRESDMLNGSTPPHMPQPQITDIETLLEYSMKLLHLFGYPWVCLTFVYLIVKESGGNLEKAVRRIAEANNDIRALNLWKATKMKIQNDLSFSSTPFSQVDTVGAPTYVGQVPYIGVVPQPGTIHLGPYPHLMSVPNVSSSPGTPSEHSTM